MNEKLKALTAKLLSKPYDHTAVYDNEIAPLMDQVFRKCKQHGMPFLAAFCKRNKPTGDGAEVTMGGCNYFDGVETTPPSMALALQVAQLSETDAVMLGMQMVKMGFIGDADADEPSSQTMH